MVLPMLLLGLMGKQSYDAGRQQTKDRRRYEAEEADAKMWRDKQRAQQAARLDAPKDFMTFAQNTPGMPGYVPPPGQMGYSAGRYGPGSPFGDAPVGVAPGPEVPSFGTEEEALKALMGSGLSPYAMEHGANLLKMGLPSQNEQRMNEMVTRPDGKQVPRWQLNESLALNPITPPARALSETELTLYRKALIQLGHARNDAEAAALLPDGSTDYVREALGLLRMAVNDTTNPTPAGGTLKPPKPSLLNGEPPLGGSSLSGGGPLLDPVTGGSKPLIPSMSTMPPNGPQAAPGLPSFSAMPTLDPQSEGGAQPDLSRFGLTDLPPLTAQYPTPEAWVQANNTNTDPRVGLDKQAAVLLGYLADAQRKNGWDDATTAFAEQYLRKTAGLLGKDIPPVVGARSPQAAQAVPPPPTMAPSPTVPPPPNMAPSPTLPPPAGVGVQPPMSPGEQDGRAFVERVVKENLWRPYDEYKDMLDAATATQQALQSPYTEPVLKYDSNGLPVEVLLDAQGNPVFLTPDQAKFQQQMYLKRTPSAPEEVEYETVQVWSPYRSQALGVTVPHKDATGYTWYSGNMKLPKGSEPDNPNIRRQYDPKGNPTFPQEYITKDGKTVYKSPSALNAIQTKTDNDLKIAKQKLDERKFSQEIAEYRAGVEERRRRDREAFAGQYTKEVDRLAALSNQWRQPVMQLVPVTEDGSTKHVRKFKLDADGKPMWEYVPGTPRSVIAEINTIEGKLHDARVRGARADGRDLGLTGQNLENYVKKVVKKLESQ